MKPHLHGIHILLLPSLQKDLASPLSENYCSQRHRIGLCAAQLYSCIFSTPQTRYKSMLFWIGADHYRHKQAKTFGSQVAESAVCARLHPPLMFSGYRPAVLRDNNTGASQTVYLLYFTHIVEKITTFLKEHVIGVSKGCVSQSESAALTRALFFTFIH